MQFYRPLWPQRRLSSSLINRHECDFSQILAELPKDSKVVSKFMNSYADMMKALEREKSDLMVDLMEQKAREKLDLTEKKAREKLELLKHIMNLENDIKQRTELLLRSKEMCNVKGALEFIRSMIQSQDKTTQDKTITFRETYRQCFDEADSRCKVYIIFKANMLT
ncbi:hypothetical protein C2G38_2082867 [Gigaspora rosea]|uniref:Uncharacterized protein n=1 Tax=Gigaspora rosea TaxID=44941 RepID=A0A397VCK5_9GLOM|nr:hypothetical protein C2G38_2082867 [Gigaspora rosea]